MSGSFRARIGVIEVVGRYGKFVPVEAPFGGAAAVSSIISITILLMAIISIRRGLLLDRGARPCVLTTAPLHSSRDKLHAAVVVSL